MLGYTFVSGLNRDLKSQGEPEWTVLYKCEIEYQTNLSPFSLRVDQLYQD